MGLFKRFWVGIGIALTLFGIFWIPNDLQNWETAAQPWGAIASMGNQTIALWCVSIASVIYITLTAARPYLSMLFGPRQVGGKYPARLAFDFDPQTQRPRDLEMDGVNTFYVMIEKSICVFVISFNRPTGFKDISVQALDNVQVNFDVVHAKDTLLILSITSPISSAGYIVECENRDPRRPPKGVKYPAAKNPL